MYGCVDVQRRDQAMANLDVLPVHERDYQRRKKEGDARLAFSRKLLTAYGYGVLAAGAGSPFLEGGPTVPEVNVLLFTLGLAFHALALYLAPVEANAKDA